MKLLYHLTMLPITLAVYLALTTTLYFIFANIVFLMVWLLDPSTDWVTFTPVMTGLLVLCDGVWTFLKWALQDVVAVQYTPSYEHFWKQDDVAE